MADALTKLNGTWLQESLEGHIGEWLKYEGVGWIARNAAWLAGYGNGKTIVDSFVHDNKYYTVRTVDPNSIFRSVMPITGKQVPTLFTESFPLIDIRQMECSATSAPDGSLDFVFFNPDGKEHSKVKRSVSEDGQTMTTVITFPSGDWGGEAGGSCVMTSTSKKQTEAKLTTEIFGTWGANFPTLIAAAESGVEAKKMVVSEPLDGLFPDAASLFKLLEETQRAEAQLGKMEETGPGKFTATKTKEDQSESIFEQEYNQEKLTFAVKSTHGGKCWGTWHFQILSEPLRMTCWNDMSNEQWSTRSSLQEGEKLSDKLLAASKKK